MREKEFSKFHSSLLSRISQRDRSQGKECVRQWNEISSHNYDFDRQQKEIDCLKTYDLSEFKRLYEDLFFNDAKRLDIQMMSHKHKEANE